MNVFAVCMHKVHYVQNAEPPYQVAMKPIVVMLLAACGLPVPFSTALQTYAVSGTCEEAHIKGLSFSLLCKLVARWQMSIAACPKSPLDFGVNRLLLCSHDSLPSALLRNTLLYPQSIALCKEGSFHIVLCLQHRRADLQRNKAPRTDKHRRNITCRKD